MTLIKPQLLQPAGGLPHMGAICRRGARRFRAPHGRHWRSDIGDRPGPSRHHPDAGPALLLAVIVPVWISSVRIQRTTIRQSNVHAVAERWASDAGWSVVGVTATGDQGLVQATGPNPAPDLAVLRRDLTDAGLNGLDVRVSLVPASYKPLPG